LVDLFFFEPLLSSPQSGSQSSLQVTSTSTHFVTQDPYWFKTQEHL
jgi:hypothetical protein